jgi:creatinine amidohydrolase
MLARYEPVRYELLRPDQVRQIRDKCPIAYIVAGSLEWHSFHNPLGCDALKAHGICCEAALRYGGVVLPPFYQGMVGVDNWGPDGWRGYTQAFNEDTMFQSAMRGIVRALVYGGWKVIVGVTGHDDPGQRDAMQRAIDELTKGTDVTGFAMMEGDLHHGTDDIPYTMDHAGAWETSCMMYLCPDKVNLDELMSRGLCTTDMIEMSGPEGIGGWNPLRFASPELGKRIVETMADLIGSKASSFLKS